MNLKGILSIEFLFAFAMMLLVIIIFIKSNIIIGKHYKNSTLEIACKEILYKVEALAYNTYYLNVNQTIYIGSVINPENYEKTTLTVIGDSSNNLIKVKIGNYECSHEFEENIQQSEASGRILKILKENDAVKFEGEA